MKNKKWIHRLNSVVVQSLLFGLIMGFLAYHFVPDSNYDLVRHRKVAESMEFVESVDDFEGVSKTTDLEIIPRLYSLAIAKIGDYDLLQFFVVVVGYTALAYILLDYRKESKLNWCRFLALFILAIFGQSMLFYFSGLYNYLAINLFALACYLDYMKDKKKMAFVVYLLSPFVHGSMLLPLGLTFLLKIRKNRISVKFFIALVIALFAFEPILGFVADLFDIEFLNAAKNTYSSYVLYNGNVIKYYDGFYMFMTVSKIILVLIACWLQRGVERTAVLRNLTYLLTTATAILSLSSVTITRFSSLILFIAVPIINDAMNEKNRRSQLFSIVVGVVAILYLIHTAYSLIPFLVI